jgi:hypothetical protein
VGKPVVVTVNVSAVPTLNVAASPDVIAGAWSTVNVNACVASGRVPFAAVIVNGYVPPLKEAGMPDRVAVPSPLLTKLTPVGSAPVSDRLGDGSPVEVTMNAPAVPTAIVAESAEVISGADDVALTVNVNACVASGRVPSTAVIVNG